MALEQVTQVFCSFYNNRDSISIDKDGTGQLIINLLQNAKQAYTEIGTSKLAIAVRFNNSVETIYCIVQTPLQNLIVEHLIMEHKVS